MSFDTMGLAPPLLAALARRGLDDPTPIQAGAIPHALAGRDVMGLAQTGTGKTMAFGLPLVHALAREGAHAAPRSALALILAPTRELASQIEGALRGISSGPGAVRIAVVVGGRGIVGQARALSRGVEVLVATPGRLIDLLERGAVRLDATRFLVLDEADQMLDMGFIHALRRIVPLLPRSRQTMLFSATMPKDMAEIAGAYLRDPVRVEVAPPGVPVDKVAQSVRFVEQTEKAALLADLLGDHVGERALVFARTKRGAERLSKSLEAQGFAAASIHGNKSQGQRDRALAGFREGSVTVLVATDVAARGIDVPGVAFVYNYELPDVPEAYVHRIGRTARAGASGKAVAFCAPDEIAEWRAIERLIGRAVPVEQGTPWPPAPKVARGKGARAPGGGGQKPAAAPAKPGGRRRPRRGGSGGGGRRAA